MNSVSPIDTLVDRDRWALLYRVSGPNRFYLLLESVGVLKTGSSVESKGLAGQFGQH